MEGQYLEPVSLGVIGLLVVVHVWRIIFWRSGEGRGGLGELRVSVHSRKRTPTPVVFNGNYWVTSGH
tara:strand:+ start:38352 stop:38552 length:201 start_codon:yes stop_codon:yes gene_type:complete